MVHLTTRLAPSSLGMWTKCEVLLPDAIRKDRPLPALYLLHGQSDDETIWMRRTIIERLADEHYLAVVMPFGDRSYYSRLANGTDYWKYITEELPAFCESHFPICGKREARFIAGLSMGGFGALKAALNRPDLYAACGALSAVCDIKWVRDGQPALYAGNFGPDAPIEPPMDLWSAAEKAGALPPSQRPKIFQYCGVEDFLYGENLKFREHLKECGLLDRWEEGPGGHCWENWNERIEHVLNWLPLDSEALAPGRKANFYGT